MYTQYHEFTIKNLEYLKDLGKSVWWSFQINGSTWLLKGSTKSSGATASYALLLTDFNSTYFTSAGTTQIQREIQEFNPLLQGGIQGIMPTLKSSISEFNPETTFTLNLPLFEIHRTINGIYQFKWIFTLTKLSSEVSKNIIKNLIVLPLFNTIAAQDQAIKAFEEQNKNNLTLDLRIAGNTNLNLELRETSRGFLAESSLESVKVEERKLQEQTEMRKKLERQADEMKRKNQGEHKTEKKVKNEMAEYKESEAEAQRRRDLEAKMNKKKEKKKLDFL